MRDALYLPHRKYRRINKARNWFNMVQPQCQINDVGVQSDVPTGWGGGGNTLSQLISLPGVADQQAISVMGYERGNRLIAVFC